MLIEWYGHSCFKVTSKGYSIVLDPYRPGMISGLGDYHIDADAVYCSHEHGDHNYREAVTLSGKKDPGIFKIGFLETYHDDANGEKRGKNKITIIEAQGLKIAHFGDLGCNLSSKQVSTLQGLDAIMIPVGGYYTIDADQAKTICDRLNPRVVFPMHYRGEGFGPAPIATVDSFTNLYDRETVMRYQANVFELDDKTPRQVAILKYR